MKTQFILRYRLFGSSIDFEKSYDNEPEARAKIYKLKTDHQDAYDISLDKVTHLYV